MTEDRIGNMEGSEDGGCATRADAGDPADAGGPAGADDGAYLALARLVRRAQAGDRTAFEELYARTAQVQYFAIVGRVGREAAPDILQELYLIAWQNIGSVRPRSFVGYLNATARHLCLRHFKRRGSSKDPAPAEDRALEEAGTERGDVAGSAAAAAEDPAVGVHARDERERLARCLREDLDDQERTAVLLRYYQDMKLDEVADALGVSLATAKRVIARALDKLRSKLGLVPAGMAFRELMAQAVEGSGTPGTLTAPWAPGAAGEGAACPSDAAPAHGRAARAVGLAAVAVAVAAVGLAAAMPRPAAAPVAPASSEETAAPADTDGPVLRESFTEGDVTVLRFYDETGTATVTCTGEDGARYEGTRAEEAGDGTGPVRPGAGESLWRIALPSGRYDLRATDALGNESEGELVADITPDAF